MEAEAPNRIKCPIELTIMHTPAIASDGVTYEYRAIKKFCDEKRFPCKSPLGIKMNSASLIVNRALVEEISEYCEAHGLPQREVEVIPEHEPSTRHSTTTTWMPTTSMDSIMRLHPPMALGDLFNADGFLDGIRKPGLVKILNACLSQLSLIHISEPTRH
eukprot:708188-Karenia_brevis.AAC.1